MFSIRHSNMKALTLFSLFFLASKIANSAELSESAEVYSNLFDEYFSRSEIVAYGYFEIPEPAIPVDELGKPTDNWEIEFHPSRVFKFDGQVDIQNIRFSVLVRNDILPYKNWYISRKEIRNLKEDSLAELARRFDEIGSNIEIARNAGEFSDQEVDELLDDLDRSLENIIGTTIPYTSRSFDRNAAERLIMPFEPYLVFLNHNGESYELIEERWGFNLFNGEDALIIMGLIEDL